MGSRAEAGSQRVLGPLGRGGGLFQIGVRDSGDGKQKFLGKAPRPVSWSRFVQEPSGANLGV